MSRKPNVKRCQVLCNGVRSGKGPRVGWQIPLRENHTTLELQEFLGFLGQHNILPKYGFPVDTVDLRTIYADSERGADIRLSRDLRMAIYEHAPGAQVVAGGRLWTSGGIYRMPGRDLVQRHYAAPSLRSGPGTAAPTSVVSPLSCRAIALTSLRADSTWPTGRVLSWSPSVSER
jgi:hypothetical protein